MTLLNQQALREQGCVLALDLKTRYNDGTNKTPDSTRYSDVNISGSYVAHTPHDATINGDCVMHIGKDGQGLMYFDGSGDYLSIADNTEMELSDSNFTIAFWCKPTTGSVSQGILAKRTSVPNISPILIAFEATNKIAISLSTNGTSYTVDTLFGTALTIGSWYFIVLVRNDSSFIGYANMIQDWSATLSGSLYDNTSSWTIGAKYDNGASAFYGYLRYPMIFKGKALDTVALRNLMEETRPDFI